LIAQLNLNESQKFTVNQVYAKSERKACKHVKAQPARW